MLILGRRANQSIVFPNCGITVRILDVNGRIAKIGIDAPRSIEIMRGELVAASSIPIAQNTSLLSDEPYNVSQGSEQDAAPDFEPAQFQLHQRIADIKASLHTFQLLRATGKEEEADSVLADLLENLAHLDKDCFDENPNPALAKHDFTKTRSNLVYERLAKYNLSTLENPPTFILLVNGANNGDETALPFGTFPGCQVYAVNSRESAHLALESDEVFDYIICNGDSTLLDELELARKIRSNNKYDRTRVFVADRSTTTLERLEQSREIGIDGWLVKPLGLQDLWNHIVESNQFET